MTKRIVELEVNDERLAGDLKHHIVGEELKWKQAFRIWYAVATAVVLIALEDLSKLTRLVKPIVVALGR